MSVFGNAPGAPGIPYWQGVPARSTVGFGNSGSLGAIDTIEEMPGLTIPSDHLNTAKIYGGLGGGLGEGTLTINGTSVPVNTEALFSGLGSLLLSRAIYAGLGYYIGGKIGPKGSSSKVAGAAACALAGPLGLAAVAAYYSR